MRLERVDGSGGTDGFSWRCLRGLAVLVVAAWLPTAWSPALLGCRVHLSVRRRLLQQEVQRYPWKCFGLKSEIRLKVASKCGGVVALRGKYLVQLESRLGYSDYCTHSQIFEEKLRPKKGFLERCIAQEKLNESTISRKEVNIYLFPFLQWCLVSSWCWN